MVDLGLSVLWADRNLFAQSSTDIGSMFAWGDNEKKANHFRADAFLSNKYGYDLEKAIGNNKRNISGNKSFDPAANNWGGQWRLPQASEIKELLWFCEWTWECRNNVYGYKVTGKNGNSIFLPVSGRQIGSEQNDLEYGYYWSGIGSTRSTDAKCLRFSKQWHVEEDVERWQGCAIRPVWANPEPSIEEIQRSIKKNYELWDNLSPVQKYETYKASFKITKQSISNDIIEDLDKHACYSEDGKKLESISTGAGRDEKWPSLIPHYGTEIICDRAYDDIRHYSLGSDTLVIPDSVYAIGNFAFESFSCFKIVLPKSLKCLTGNPIKNKSITIISESPYYKIEDKILVSTDNILLVANLDNDSSIICINNNIEIVGRNAFYSNKKLEHLVIAKSVIALSDFFTQGCDNLSILEFLGEVQVFDNYAFKGCNEIKAIIVPDQSLEYYKSVLPREFIDRIKPKSSVVDVEKTIELIALENDLKKSTQYNFDSFVSKPSKEDISLIKKYMDKFKKTFVDKDEWENTLIDWGVHVNEEHESWETGDAQYSFDGTRLLRHHSEDETYSVKNGTKVICDYAFGDSRDLENIIIPGSVTCLGDMVFYYNGPSRFTIPKSIRTITGNPFVKCSLKLTCESSFFTIEDEGLYDKDKQILISIYDAEEYRQTISINQNIKVIGRNAFNGIFLDGNPLIIPDTVIYIADEAFRDTIMDIKLPSKLIEIGESAFEHSYLKKVQIPNTVQNIGPKAFYWCEQLKEVILPTNIKTIEKETFSSCKELTAIHIPEGCISIKEMAFWSCYKLIDVYLPSTLEKIEKNAFGNGHLSSVVVSKKTIIEDEAFPKECKIIYRD